MSEISACIFTGKYIYSVYSKFLILSGNFLAGAALLCFPILPLLAWGVICVIFAGFGFGVAVTTIITILQHSSSSEMRGRVLSIFYFVYFGGYTLGNFSIGWLASRFGSASVISLSGGLLLAITIMFLPMRSKILEIN